MTAELAEDGHWEHGKNHAVACSDKAWWGIWGKPLSTKPISEGWLCHLRELPPFPEYTPLTPLQLSSVLRTYSPGKAAGPDGWQVKELKLWTGPLLEWVAELLALVEATGQWPKELTRAETVLLPKGGSADPLDRRPITLLPMLYRIWAALRATQLRAWMRSAGIPTLVAGRSGTMKSAEHQGLLLGLELEEARAFDESLAGVAVDWSKCYDHLGFHFVEANLTAAGVPAWFSGPLLAMYKAPGTSRSMVPLGRPGYPCVAYRLAVRLRLTSLPC